MTPYTPAEKEFLKKITGIIEENISDEQFGVSELAYSIGMSRSNLLRKIKKLTGLSASRFISQVRLEKAMEMLRKEDYTVSEVTFKVGFNSTSYFIKCFREHYGYPPGEVVQRAAEEADQDQDTLESSQNIQVEKKRGWHTIVKWAVMLLVIICSGYFLHYFDVFESFSPEHETMNKKSIAVLPFINDSYDSSNVYFVNGLMESILNDLQKIEGLRVISRTSVEKYRNNSKPIAEIAEELQVKYIVEGSGQKRDDKIFLHIQLIEAATDNHLMSEQYISETSDIFQLQLDIARQIAGKIELVLGPDEQKLISSSYTDDPVAYDLFLKGRDRLNQGTEEGLYEGMAYLQQAIRQDPNYARAYAAIGIAYYYADFFKAEPLFTDSINYYADLALFHDAELATGMLAKAMFYLRTGEHGLALPYLEKALEYNPNSTLVLNMLSDYYTNISPDTEKYLEYALRGMSIDPAPHDSMQTSLAYLHIANALVQSGFVDEARRYAERSLVYDPTNIYSMYVEEYIKYAKERDIEGLCQGLVKVLKVDTSRLDVLQETAKSFYFARDYKEAYRYYRPLVDIRKAYSIDIFNHENAKIGFVYREIGLEAEADSLLAIYKEYYQNDQSIYKHLSMAAYASFYGQTDEAIEQLKLFLEEENYFYWIILFLDIEPLFDSLKSHPEYKGVIKEIKSKFWEYHEEMRASLEGKGVI